MSQIMILGAAGFIGTNLTYRLSADGEDITCFDRPGADMTHARICGAKVAQGSISDFSADDYSGLEGIDTLYHLVSTTCPTNSNMNIAAELEENILSSVRLLDACVKAGVGKVVFLSSGGTVYGREHDGVLSENDETSPISSYGIQKLVIEKYLYLYREMYGLDYRIVRLSNPYGPYQRPNGIQGLVSTCTWKALHDEPIEIYGDGSVVRDYIYIDDAVEGILNIAGDGSAYRLYNLGSGHGTSVKEVLDTVSAVLGKELNIRYTPARKVDVPVNILDISRYEAEYGDPVSTDLEAGIARLAEFYASR